MKYTKLAQPSMLCGLAVDESQGVSMVQARTSTGYQWCVAGACIPQLRAAVLVNHTRSVLCYVCTVWLNMLFESTHTTQVHGDGATLRIENKYLLVQSDSVVFQNL
jgi:hypothetical protein